VMEAMKERGIDISQRRPKLLTTEMVQNADRVITMGCGVEEACPVVFVPVEDWQLEDPEGKPIQKVREIRDEIEAKVKKLVEEIRQE
jgi:arsenate reductase (thioredoxin)